MRTILVSPESGREQVAENISEVEVFMASRVNDLQEYGWSNETIAEALGVNKEFVEDLRELLGSHL